MKNLFSFIFVAILLVSCQVQKTDLSLNLEKGKEYQQTTSTKAVVEQNFNGIKMNITMTNSGTMIFLVKSIENDLYEMDVKFKKMNMSMQLPQGNTMEFDSEKAGSDDIFSSILGVMIDKTFHVKMNNYGKIVEIKNVEALWDKAISQFDQLPKMQKRQIKDQISKAYGSNAIKGSIEMASAIYPEKKVNKGDKWSVSKNLEAGMSAKVNSHYEFADLTSDYALIKGNSEIITADKDAYVKNNGMSMRYDLTGTMSSEIKVDNKSGWIISAKIDQELKGETHIKGNAQAPDGMTIPMKVSSKTTISNQ